MSGTHITNMTICTDVSSSNDVTRSAFNLFVWAQFELQAGIMCASAPSMRVFFRRYLGVSSGSRSGNRSNGIYGKSLPTDKSITVVRDTQVTFGKNGEGGSATPHAGQVEFDKISEEEVKAWSPNRSEERLTRYSHEEDGFALTDLSGKAYGK